MIKDKPVLCKCPKCRSSNVDLIEAYDHGYSTYGRFWYRVECLDCGYFIADREEFNSEALLVYPEGDCIKVWNLYSQPVKDTLITELVGALEWYEQQVKDCKKITSEGTAARAALDSDGGNRAAAALTKAKGSER